MLNTRVFIIAGNEFKYLLGQPAFWLLLALLGVLTLSLSPAVFIPSEPAIGGDPVWINSRYALLQFFAFSGLLGYTIVGSILAGLSITRDVDSGIAPIIHSTPLSPAEYVAGKMMGVIAISGIALVWHIGMTVISYELISVVQRELGKGPFNVWHYLSMGVLGAVPGWWVSVGLTFFAAVLTKRSLVVYAVPVVILITTLSYALVTPTATSWHLPAMLFDLSGIRWMLHTVFATDLGVLHYNEAPVAFDFVYLYNRLLHLGIGSLSFALAIPVVKHWMWRPDKKRIAVFQGWRWGRLFKKEYDGISARSFSMLEMHSVTLSRWKEIDYLVRMEWRDVIRQPIYYLIVLVYGRAGKRNCQ